MYYYKNEEGFERGELLGCISLTGLDSIQQIESRFLFPSPFLILAAVFFKFGFWVSETEPLNNLGREEGRICLKFTLHAEPLFSALIPNAKCMSGWKFFRMF